MKSMTGYCSRKVDFDKFQFHLELRSVNSRYGEFTIKLPKEFAAAENKLRKLLSQQIKRGRVSLTVSFDYIGEVTHDIFVNMDLASRYLGALDLIQKKLGFNTSPELDHVLGFRDIFEKKERIIQDKDLGLLEQALAHVIQDFDRMRSEEGAYLQASISKHLQQIKKVFATIDKEIPQIRTRYREQLHDRIQALLGDVEVDEQRLLMEVAMHAERSDVTEEQERFHCHLEKLDTILSSSKKGEVGRKMDFILQELNREINTLGSKVNNYSISEKVVEIKSCLEKIREQIQNIE